jgi:hypothetical protein
LPLIIREAKKRSRGLLDPNFEEYVQQGGLAYAEALQTWDPLKGAFITHLYWIIRHEMQEYKRVYLKDSKFQFQEITPSQFQSENNPEREVIFRDKITKASNEAKMVINLILNSPEDLINLSANKLRIFRKGIDQFLKNAGFKSPKKREKILKELQQLVKD